MFPQEIAGNFRLYELMIFLCYTEPRETSGGDRDRQFADYEFTNTNNTNTNVSNVNTGNVGGNAKLQETVITVNGLPGNVNLSQITKMFGDFGNISNITFSPYQMMGHSFMNAIVCVNLKNQGGAGNVSSQSSGGDQQLSFQSDIPEEREVKDRSVDKDAMKTLRRNVNTSPMAQNQRQIQQKQGGIDPDVLAKEIDELLADTDDEDESSDSSTDDEGGDDDSSSEEESSSSDSDSDDDDKK